MIADLIHVGNKLAGHAGHSLNCCLSYKINGCTCGQREALAEWRALTKENNNDH
jgi:hypothetical protein